MKIRKNDKQLAEALKSESLQIRETGLGDTLTISDVRNAIKMANAIYQNNDGSYIIYSGKWIIKINL